MIDDAGESRRVKFYGAADLSNYWQAERVMEVAARLEAAAAPPTVVDAIELHNARLFIESGCLPVSYSEAQRAAAAALTPELHAAVARFFYAINHTNVAAQLVEIPYDYRPDLLELLARYKAFDRCDAKVMLPALEAAGINLAEMLCCKKLVNTYDENIRGALISEARNAELLIRKYLSREAPSDIYLPKSFTSTDAGELLDNYLGDADANLNFVRLIETAPVEVQSGVDAKLKLKAKRRSAQMVEDLFKENSGFKTGTDLRISDSQDEPVIKELDGMVAKFTYSRSWLDRTLDRASILNNFQHLFEFADDHALLTLPSYPAELGVFERFLTTTGRRDYHTGAEFRAKDTSSLLQTHMYRDYLSSKEIDLEGVVGWFFGTYLAEEFGALSFSFAPSARASSYLEKARHLFAEMEGFVNQFRLYVQNGELDRDLLALTSDPVAYDRIPSLLDGKYVYSTDHEEIRGVLHTLFSDQSGLVYINNSLKDTSAARLLVRNAISYTDFNEHQRPTIDQLIKLGLLKDNGARVQIASMQQVMVLHLLFTKQAAPYHRLTPAGRGQVEALETRGWVSRRATLLTEAEASYFNYFLNKAEFSNGPELRNKYLHGSQAVADSGNEHLQTYITAMRMIISLVIKINDDFCLSATKHGAIS